MKKIEDEVQLKKELDSAGVRYGSTMNDFRFYVEFVDNKAWSTIFHGIYQSPIVAIRQLNDVIKKTNLPDTDIDIVLRFAFSSKEEKYDFYTFNFVLSPYLYFTKKEVNIGDSADSDKISRSDSE